MNFDSNNNVTAVCKITSIALIIFGFILAIVLGSQFATVEKIKDYYRGVETIRHFNWSIFFSVLVGSFIPSLLIYALGEIIEILNTLNDNTYEILNQMSNKKKTTGGDWICSACETKNESTAQFCKTCGAYK